MFICAAGLALSASAQPQQQGQGGGLGQMPQPPEVTTDPNVPKTREPNEGEIVFDYKDTPLNQVIQELGAKTGKNFEIDQTAGQKTVTVMTHAPVPVDLALDILESLLKSNDFAIIEALDGHLLKVVPAQQGGPARSTDNIPLHIGTEEPIKGFDRYETHVLPLKYALVEDLTEILQGLGSPNAQISVYNPTNTLLLTDTITGLNRMLDFLRVIDIPGNEVDVEMFVLEYTSAETVSNQIQDVLLPEGAEGTGQRTPTTAIAQPAAGRRAIPGQRTQPVVAGSVEETLNVTFDERLNAVIVTATEGMMERCRSLISRLDQPTPWEAHNMRVYDLQNGDAALVAEALNAMISGTTPRAEAQQGGGGGAQTAEVQPFEKSVTITPYEQTNALLVLASPQDYNRLKDIIARLDVPPRQVHVEAIIMDVVVDDSASIQVNTVGLDDEDWFGFNNAATLANALVNGPLSLAAGSSGGTIGIVDGTTQAPVPDGAGGITTTTIPNIPLLIQFIESLTAVDILSQPALTTVDNEEAEIIVGQEVPFIVGSSSALDQSAVGRSVFNRIEREDVGIQLKVTPQISEGDYIFMELEVVVSQTVASDVGADVNLVGPTLQKSEVLAKVTIQDGSTGIIGGLVSEQVSQSRTQTPVLGDLPVIGWLFRNRGSGRNKRNLVVLVTPTIVRDATDVERLTDWKLDTFNAANVDVWFEEGYISKIKNKHEARKKYRPSEKHSDKYRGGRAGFNRGDLE